jgi:hypothetical protein
MLRLCAAGAVVVMLASGMRTAQSAPASDVFVAPLSAADGTLRVGTPQNISNSPGYDNQPFFAPGGEALYFTSDRASAPPAPQRADDSKQQAAASLMRTDIYRFDFSTGRTARVTETPEGEYSPTVMPDGKHISVIRVEADGTQRLWSFTTDGKNSGVILADVKPVGYHAWLDATTVAMFMLGQPATLQVADLTTGAAQTVARNIGQSLQAIPGGGVSFIEQAGEGDQRTLTVAELRRENGKTVTRALTPAVKGARQAWTAWAPDRTLLMPHDGTLYAWKAGGSGWQAVADLASLGLRNVTRLAVSPTGDRIALVAAQ